MLTSGIEIEHVSDYGKSPEGTLITFSKETCIIGEAIGSLQTDVLVWLWTDTSSWAASHDNPKEINVTS